MKLWLRTTSSIWLVSLGVAGMIMAFMISIRVENYPDGLLWKLILMLSLCFTSMGLYLYYRIHRSGTGIRINPKWITYLNDFINLSFGTLAAFLFLNFLFVQLQMGPLEDDEFGIFMGIYYFALGIPFVAFFTCRIKGQVIKVSKTAIESSGFLHHQTINWDEIIEIKLKDEYIVKRRLGFVLPQKLQKKMIFVSKTGKVLIINEPQTINAKRKLFQHIITHVPIRLKSAFGAVFAKW